MFSKALLMSLQGSFIHFLSSVSIFMTIALNSLPSNLLSCISLVPHPGFLSYSIIWIYSSVSSFCLTFCVCFCELGKTATSSHLEAVALYRSFHSRDCPHQLCPDGWLGWAWDRRSLEGLKNNGAPWCLWPLTGFQHPSAHFIDT